MTYVKFIFSRFSICSWLQLHNKARATYCSTIGTPTATSCSSIVVTPDPLTRIGCRPPPRTIEQKCDDMTSKSTASRTRRKPTNGKPEKPRPDFPLFPHASGKWAKVTRGKMYYFGRWNDPDGAEAEYLKVADDLHAGREPRSESNGDGITLREVYNSFMKSKRTKLGAENLSSRTFVGYDTICRLLLDEFGYSRSVADLWPADFEKLYGRLAKKFSTTSLGG